MEFFPHLAFVLYFQENLLFIKEVHCKPADTKESGLICYFCPGLRHEFHKSSKEEIDCASNVHYSRKQIDCDGVKSYHLKANCPFLPSFHIDDIVEQSHHCEAV